MSQNLYEDAIAEALRLAELAEENARNKIIDAVTPRIRSLIERQLLGEDEHLDPLEDEEEEEFDDELGPEVLDLDAAADDLAVGAPDDFGGPPPALEPMGAPADLELPAPGGDQDAATVSVTPDGEVEISVGDISIEVDTGDDDDDIYGDGDDLLLGQGVAEALAEGERAARALRRGARAGILEER